MGSRYIAQQRLPEIGVEGQKALSESSVLMVGCGALGSPVAMYLAGAGIGKITVADFDTVDLSNLHRQVFYQENEVGKGKSSLLSQRISGLNSDIKVKVLDKVVTSKVLSELTDNFDLIIDAADNPPTTYLLDEFCSKKGIPFITAGVSDWRAQIYVSVPGGASFQEIFPTPESQQGIFPCSVTGIVGPVASFAASVQASEAIKLLIDKGQSNSKLVIANLLTLQFDVLSC